MKTVIIAIVVVLIGGGAFMFVHHSAAEQQHAAEALRAQVQEAKSKEDAAKAQVKQMQEEQRSLRGDLRVAEIDAATARNAAAAAKTNLPALPSSPLAVTGVPGGAKPPGAGMGGMLKQMMDNPDMRKMIEAQQKVMVDTMYGPLVKQLGLSPEDGEKLKSLFLDQQMKAVSSAGALMDQSNKQEHDAAAKTLADQQTDLDTQLKTLLGDAKFDQYKDYKSSMADRLVLNQFNQTANLKPEQSDQLLEIMKQERKAAMEANPDVMPADPAKNMKILESDEAAEAFFKKQEELNASVLDKAQGVLDDAQLQSLSSFQSNQVNMQRLGIKMARTMFQGGGTAAPAPPTPVSTQQ